ncbi:DUF924 family protein [Jannaschia sp. 2305UL9-9]|uniref:DUF924 family protein n=1 Tax=Jannaschia sp. 2305UL9-9 TaxID=3121638 RepID=UPI003528C106
MTFDPEDVLTFWLDEEGPQSWYAGGEALDDRIRSRFEPAWEAARKGSLSSWRKRARSALALLLLTDQFSRNMFRGTAKAFATDAIARSVARQAIDAGFDRDIAEPARQFFYLPLEHSESLADQARAVRLIMLHMDAPETLLHARAHRAIIRQFGRFPFRNEALGRVTTAREQAFLDGGAYGAVVRHLRAG